MAGEQQHRDLLRYVKGPRGFTPKINAAIDALNELRARPSPPSQVFGTFPLAPPSDPTFPAIITGSASLASASVAVGGGASVTVIYRFKYAWSEAELNGDLWQIKTGGRSGTTTTDYALNDYEDFHTGAISWNATITSSNAYPVGHRPKPVGGASADTGQGHSYNVLVRMRAITDINSATKYRFAAPGGHFGACT